MAFICEMAMVGENTLERIDGQCGVHGLAMDHSDCSFNIHRGCFECQR